MSESRRGERIVYVFIDASNLWQAIKTKGKFLDFEKVIKFVKERFSTNQVKTFYYTAYPAQGTRDYNLDGKHKFFTFLKRGLDFVVRKKELKRISVVTANGESVEEKGNMDVEMTVDAMHHLGRYDTAVFFTGDSDFLVLINYLRNHNKRVFVFSSKNNVSQELRTGADGYTDLLDIDNIWGKELKHRAELNKGPK